MVAIAILAVLNLAAITIVTGLGHERLEALELVVGMNWERNLPTGFSVGLILAASLLTAGVAWHHRITGAQRWTGWVVLAGAFAVLAVDEGLQIHERVGQRLDRELDLGGPLQFPWVAPYLVGTAIFTLLIVPMLRDLDRDTFRRFVIAGGVYVGGAAGLEALSGIRYDANGEQIDYVFLLMATAEEITEMAGMSLFIVAVSRYLIELVNPVPVEEMVDLNPA